MRFLADECCDAMVVDGLRADGHDVAYVAEGPCGITDDRVLEMAFREDRILITEDKDFGELVVRLARPTRGVLLIRLDDMTSREKFAKISLALNDIAHRLAGSFAVIDREKIRIRPITARL